MSDDEIDLELLELLRQRLGINNQPTDEISSDTGVLKDAEYIYNNAVDVSIDMWGTKSAALKIWKIIQERGYSLQAWSEHELHPKLGEELNEVEMANFVFTMDLLNFSFWSELSEQDRFQVEYRGRRWTGYMSLVACLRRALSQGTPITSPRFWRSPSCTDEVIKDVFRSATDEQIPLLDERIAILREAGNVLEEFDDVIQKDASVEDLEDPCSINDLTSAVQGTSQDDDLAIDAENAHAHTAISTAIHDEALSPTPTDEGWISVENDRAIHAVEGSSKGRTPDLTMFASGTDQSVVQFIARADKSAGKLVNLLVKYFSSFRDECRYEGRKLRLLKRAQIFVADLHAACNCQGLGDFSDIDNLTMFADYRVPQMLHRLGVINYCPALETRILRKLPLEHGGSWEVQIRGCTVWATELLRREISRQPGAENVNAVLIDFLLYDLSKELELTAFPHHRTRSISY